MTSCRFTCEITLVPSALFALVPAMSLDALDKIKPSQTTTTSPKEAEITMIVETTQNCRA